MSLAAAAAQTFTDFFHREPEFIVRTPGQVNLIGDHTDYNEGFALPVAIDREMWVAMAVRDDRNITVHATPFGYTMTYSLDTLQKSGPSWLEYSKGIAWQLEKKGHILRGYDIVVVNAIPQGAGFSFSIASEIAALCTFETASSFRLDPVDRAIFGQRTETQWLNRPCSIAYQLSCSNGKVGHALLIDCRSLDCIHLPLPADTTIIVMDTATCHRLEDAAYDDRRRDCEEACRAFGVSSLRDVSTERFFAEYDSLKEPCRRRARHAVTENIRTLAAADALRTGDAIRFGALMSESHISLRNDFEGGHEPIDVITRIARNHPACFGARMTGAGFGGCAVALIRTDGTADFIRAVQRDYTLEIGLEPVLHVCNSVNGCTVVSWKEIKKGKA